MTLFWQRVERKEASTTKHAYIHPVQQKGVRAERKRGSEALDEIAKFFHLLPLTNKKVSIAYTNEMNGSLFLHSF
jgi:hypothetical protein